MAVIVAAKNRDVAYLVLLAPHAKSVRAGFSTFRRYLVKENGGSESKEAQADWDEFYARTVFPAVEKCQTNWQEILEQGKTIARKAYLVGGQADYFAGDIPTLAEAVRKSGSTNCVTRMMPKAGHTLDNPAVSQERPVPELLPTVSQWLEGVASPDHAK